MNRPSPGTLTYRQHHPDGAPRGRPARDLLARGLGVARLVIVSGALAIATPALPQTFEEAVWANTGLALQYCLTEGAAGATRAAWFRQAGFSERVERSSVNSDTTHIFTAPADTVEVELYYGEMPQHCIVTTRHMGVTQGSALLDGLVPQIFPGFARRVIPGAGADCVTYEDPTNPIGLAIGVNSATDQGCAENGTAVFYSTYRV
ncbi:hypothetical protein [Roseobacter sinensis]|uniref:Uncharacterized protein n=1 Tax=Roseobacter sinensis TaxID=2931391 RepID=A0ABT3BF45_9RHOB|nr:hypothetical protein [Roseobacter sp. WL0113]MCV3272190.1 hypothetical protein [Roseobacter sp. WL0113]